jgi:hypothetical protein
LQELPNEREPQLFGLDVTRKSSCLGTIDQWEPGTLRQVLSGASDAGIRFDDLCSLLESLGFEKRTKGSHNIFRKAGVDEKINLQRDGNNAKPYQVKQVRAILLLHKLGQAE